MIQKAYLVIPDRARFLWGRYGVIIPLLIGFNILDIITTVIGLNIGASELNPLGSLVGMPTFFCIKFLVPFVVAIELSIRQKINARKTLIFCLFLFGIVLLNNIVQLYLYWKLL